MFWIKGIGKVNKYILCCTCPAGCIVIHRSSNLTVYNVAIGDVALVIDMVLNRYKATMNKTGDLFVCVCVCVCVPAACVPQRDGEGGDDASFEPRGSPGAL